MAAREPSTFTIGDLLVDLDRARVTRGGVDIPVPGLSFDMLVVLMDAAPRVVSLDELMERVWTGLVVSPETVSQRVKLLRRALDDDSESPRYIAGVRGRGYRLVPPVERVPAAPPAVVLEIGEQPSPVPMAQEASSTDVDAARPLLARAPRGRPGVFIAIVASIAALAAAIGFGLPYTPELSASKAAPAPSRLAPVAGRLPSVAVLPFENRSDQSKDVYFVDGVHEDILTQLSKVGGIKVISQPSVERFRSTTLPLKSVAEQLGVTAILEGSVQRAGDRVRIAVQLIDAPTGTQLWAEQYDRELTAANIFAIQSDVAVAISSALRATLTAAEKARINVVPTRVLAAWEAYQLGNQRIARRNGKALEEAEQFMRQAIDLDPTFALAHAGLAQALTLRVVFGGAPMDDTLTQAEEAAMQALALDSNLAEAWAISGLIAEKRRRDDDAETMLRRAIELNPNYAIAYQWLGGSRNMADRPDEAMAYGKRALELDPLSSIVKMFYAAGLCGAGRYAEGTQRLVEIAESDPGFAPAFFLLAMHTAYASNRFSLAIPLMSRAIDINPKNQVAGALRTLLRIDLGEVVPAQDLVDTADRVAKMEGGDYAAENAILFFLRQGDEASAVRYAKSAVAIEPQSRIALAVLRRDDQQRGRIQAARARYEYAHGIRAGAMPDRVDRGNYGITIDFAAVLRASGDNERARVLLERSAAIVDHVPRLGVFGHGIADVQILALRGEKARALAKLREAEREGWRGPHWRYYRDFDPDLASIRNEPEFKAVFADIERDMARQRAEFAARPDDARLDLTALLR